MTEKQFLANFRKHLRVAKKYLIKEKVIDKLIDGECPFIGCKVCSNNRRCSASPCPIDVITEKYGEGQYDENSGYYNVTGSDLEIKMIKIVKQTKWR